MSKNILLFMETEGSLPCSQKPASDHSPPSSAKVTNAWSYTSIPNMPSWHDAALKHRDNFTFYLHHVT